jgi:hypothetical protein
VHLATDGPGDTSNVLVGGRGQWVEEQTTVGLSDIDAVESGRVEMHVEPERVRSLPALPAAQPRGRAWQPSQGSHHNVHRDNSGRIRAACTRTPRLCWARSPCIEREESHEWECHSEGRPRTRQAQRRAVRRLLVLRPRVARVFRRDRRRRHGQRPPGPDPRPPRRRPRPPSPHFSPAVNCRRRPAVTLSTEEERRRARHCHGDPGRVPKPSRALASAGQARLRQRVR